MVHAAVILLLLPMATALQTPKTCGNLPMKTFSCQSKQCKNPLLSQECSVPKCHFKEKLIKAGIKKTCVDNKKSIDGCTKVCQHRIRMCCYRCPLKTSLKLSPSRVYTCQCMPPYVQYGSTCKVGNFRLYGTCNLYSYIDREFSECKGDNNYLQNYGYKYCNKFSKVTRKKLSPKGKRWLDSTLKCLQREIVDITQSSYASCKDIKNKAFNSHPKCYTQEKNSICDLSPNDQQKIFRTIARGDLFTLSSAKQMAKTLKKCSEDVLVFARTSQNPDPEPAPGVGSAAISGANSIVNPGAGSDVGSVASSGVGSSVGPAAISGASSIVNPGAGSGVGSVASSGVGSSVGSAATSGLGFALG